MDGSLYSEITGKVPKTVVLDINNPALDAKYKDNIEVTRHRADEVFLRVTRLLLDKGYVVMIDQSYLGKEKTFLLSLVNNKRSSLPKNELNMVRATSEIFNKWVTFNKILWTDIDQLGRSFPKEYNRLKTDGWFWSNEWHDKNLVLAPKNPEGALILHLTVEITNLGSFKVTSLLGATGMTTLWDLTGSLKIEKDGKTVYQKRYEPFPIPKNYSFKAIESPDIGKLKALESEINDFFK